MWGLPPEKLVAVCQLFLGQACVSGHLTPALAELETMTGTCAWCVCVCARAHALRLHPEKQECLTTAHPHGTAEPVSIFPYSTSSFFSRVRCLSLREAILLPTYCLMACMDDRDCIAIQ